MPLNGWPIAAADRQWQETREASRRGQRSTADGHGQKRALRTLAVACQPLTVTRPHYAILARRVSH